ncbi:MAG TPA: S9 family peptidase [Gemmatimonadales bacterium]|nr:S9 family peptidase [Gemmatimonadales bacterium]
MRWTVLALVCSALPGTLAAQTPATPRPMKLVDLLDVPSLSDPQLSPDSRELLYVLSAADWKANRNVGHIWRAGADGSAPAVQMTNGPRGESAPRWSPDGHMIAFVATRDTDVAQIYLINDAGGEARQLTHHATSLGNITWAPSGDAIFFVAEEPKTKEQRDKERQKDDVFAYDENYQQHHLWKVTLADGAEHRITEGDYSVLDYALSRDGSRIIQHRAPDPLLGDAERGEVWVTDAAGASAVQLTHNQVGESDAQLSPDNTRVLFLAGANARFESYYNDNIFLVPAAGGGGGAAAPLLPDLAYEVEDAHWSRDGSSIVFQANMGAHSELFQVDVATRAVRQITNGAHAIRAWAFDPATGKSLLSFDQPTNPGDLWLLATAAAGAPPTQVTHVFDHLAREFRLPREEKITWKGADGVTVEGLLFYPLDYQPGHRYPLVVQTHGGPASSDRFGFAGGTTSYVPVLTAMGYAVLHPNYRGSTGYGNTFLRDMVGHYYQNAHLDVLAGIDRVIALGVADSARLIAMGWSAGGHMTDKLITFTHRLKAASSGAGAVNWISMYAQSDIRTYRTPWFGGTPWQRNAPITVYWDNSPLKDIANATTPTLIFVGQNDPRVPMPQSVELYRALRANGVPTRLYVAPREPHGWAEPRHRLFKMNAELEWFERYAMGRGYVWEKAPD